MKKEKTTSKIKYSSKVLCHRCNKNEATLDEHTCPFQVEINDDDKSTCNCCDECCQNCADDI